MPRRPDETGVFADPARGRPIYLGDFWTKVRVRARISGCRIHDLRHSFASHAATRSETLLMIGKLLGYATIQSTARYAHLDDGTLIDAAEQVGVAIERLTP